MMSSLPNSDVVKFRTGGQDVIASGTVVVIGKALELSLGDLAWAFEFTADEKNKQPRMEPGEDTGKRAVIKLVNFDNVLGIGPTDPVRIGNYLGSPLLIAFVVHRLGDSSLRSFQYTLIRGV